MMWTLWLLSWNSLWSKGRLVHQQAPPQGKRGMKDRRSRSRSAENIDLEFQESRRSSSASHSSKLKVAKLVDGYLQQIAKDVNLPLSKFVTLAESVPEFSRLDHDDLYRAIDIYLKALTLGFKKGPPQVIEEFLTSRLGEHRQETGQVFQELCEAMNRLNLKLMELLGISMGLTDRTYFRRFFEDGNAIFRCNYLCS